MIKTIFLSGLLSLLSLIALAQARKVGGTIKDENGNPLENVTVLIKGEKLGTSSDEKGKFEIYIPSGSVQILVLTHIAAEKKEVNVAGLSNVEISMKLIVQEGKDVVVVGFGRQKKISVVGAVDRIPPAQLQLPGRALANNMAGRLAGVIAIQGSGEPGRDGAEFWIRGINTFSGSTRPLIIVDGVERDMNDIDPGEIASFSILKDATATAVYGVRGANGVVVITTKRGTVGKPQISVRLENSISRFTELAKMVDGPTNMELYNEALSNMGKTPIHSADKIQKTRDGFDPYYYPNVNWMDALMRKWATSQHGNLNVSGGADKIRYFVSGSFLNQNGMFKRTKEYSFNNNINYKRYNFRSNVDVNVTNTTQLSLNLAGLMEEKNSPAAGSDGIFGAIRVADPTWYPISYPDKTKIPSRKQTNNPWRLLAHSGYRQDYYSKLRSDFIVNQQLGFLTKGLSARYHFAFDSYVAANTQRTINPKQWLITPYSINPDGTPVLKDGDGNYNYQDQDPGNSDSYHDYLVPGTDGNGNGTDRTFYNEFSVNYNRVFGDHTVGAMALYNRNDFLNPQSGDLIGSVPSRRQGLAGRFTYNFLEKYFFEYNFGYNGSENYAPGKRMGFFPSYALGWVASNEKFFEPLLKTIDYLKLRASYGKVGNDRLPPGNRFAYITRVGPTSTNVGFGNSDGYGYGSGPGFNITYYGNADASWEIAQKANLGAEIGLFNKLRINADLFYEKRTNIWDEISRTADFYGLPTVPTANVGIVENKGLDFSIDYTQKVNRDLSIQSKLTFYIGKNKIVANGQADPKYPYQSLIGQQIYRYMGYVSLGLFADSAEILRSPSQSTLGEVRPGDIKYKDMNGDGRIDEYDRIFLGYPDVPQMTYGFGSTITYKTFDLGFLFQGVGRVTFFPRPKPFENVGVGNTYAIMLDRWTKENPNLNARYPRLAEGQQSNNYVASTFWQQKGDYLRLKQLELGYNLSERMIKKAKVFRAARIYMNGLNLFTWSKFTWWDPEARSTGGVYYSLQKVYNIGVDLKF